VSALLAAVFAAELIAAAALITRTPAPPGRSVAGVEPVVIAGRTIRLVDLQGRGSREVLTRVAADIGPAIEAVNGFWGTDWPRTVSVVATGSDSQFRAEAGGGPPAQWADIAAVAVADRVDPARHIAVNQRIVFAPAAADMSERSLRIVLTHELFHYATRSATALDAPRWLTEAVADFVARPRTALPDVSVVSQLPTALPADADLDTPGPQRSLAYDRAWWFARFVADTDGAATLRRLYQLACGAGHADISVAVQEVLDADTRDVVARWRQWLTR
jgi:hypothetical protein